MRVHIVLPFLLLAACHPPAKSPAPADTADENTVEQSMENSQFAVEDQIENDAIDQEDVEANLD
ncbi:MAG: hypothetical protein KF730_01660 [Sphingomonas sp.]|uniref:hypothetical protein n=1 Tax=Sphingomonas sp. TaxID=28214 RepID=UPI0025F7CA6A|nr:hypothetical protein [Sphingomonas sp.]MBX3563258.1 hypothetical protein [Sphingomonas sp.]